MIENVRPIPRWSVDSAFGVHITKIAPSSGSARISGRT
jgi:hypothetical protein